MKTRTMLIIAWIAAFAGLACIAGQIYLWWRIWEDL